VSSQSTAESGKSIFISYRREDSQDVTGRIYDRLIQKLNPESIFKDVDTVPMGVDFRKHLEQEVAGCRVLLVIVGRRWAENQRLQDKRDFVRIEIEYGLDKDRGILVVPVLVGNADMPSTDQLPASLKDFAFRNAIQVRPDPDFHRDMDKLVKSLIDIVGKDLGKQRLVTEIEVPTHKPYKIRGRKFYEPKELAIYLSENWTEGVKHLGGEYISVWVKTQYQDQGLAVDLADITSKDDLTADQKLSLTLLVLSEDIPLLWKGDEVNREWLAANPERAIEISENDFPQLYERYRPEDDVNLRQIAGQIQQVMADEALEGKLRNLAITLILDPQAPLQWGGRTITQRWLAEHPQNTVDICQSKLPELHDQCRPEDELRLLDIAHRVRSVMEDHSLTQGLRFSAISLVVDPNQPLKLGSDLVTPKWLVKNLNQATKAICSSTLPSLHKSVTGEDWLEQAAHRFNQVIAESDLHGAARDAVFRLALTPESPLKWDGHEVSNEWLNSKCKEAIEFLNSPVPAWVHKLKGDISYLKLRDTMVAAQEAERLQKVEAERLQKMEAERFQKVEAERFQKVEAKRIQKVEAERFQKLKAKRLQKVEAERLQKVEAERLQKEEAERLQKEEAERLQKMEAERFQKVEAKRIQKVEAERFQKLKAKRLQKEEAERLQKVEAERLQKEEAERLQKVEAERREKLELTRIANEQYQKESMAYVMDFGVQIDKALAKKLIKARDWESLNIPWAEAKADPQTPYLLNSLGNENLLATLTTKTPEYLDIVALVSALPEIKKKEENNSWEYIKNLGVKTWNKSSAIKLIRCNDWKAVNPQLEKIRQDPATPHLLDFLGNQRLSEIYISEKPEYLEAVALVCALQEEKVRYAKQKTDEFTAAKRKADQAKRKADQAKRKADQAKRKADQAKKKRTSTILTVLGWTVFVGSVILTHKILTPVFGDHLLLDILKWGIILSIAGVYGLFIADFEETKIPIAPRMAAALAGLAFLYWSWNLSGGWVESWDIGGWSGWLVPVRLVLLLFIMLVLTFIFLEIPGWIGLPVSALAVLALVYQGLSLNSVPAEDTSGGGTSTDSILHEQILKKFDKNGDGKLDEKERPTPGQLQDFLDERAKMEKEAAAQKAGTAPKPTKLSVWFSSPPACASPALV
jgi:hypothetical protein